MKTLVLIRHAKSSWKYTGLADQDRPLNKRGRRDAPMMGQRLAKRGLALEQIMTSPALRALRTAQAIGDAVGLRPGNLCVDPLIYGAGVHQLIGCIQQFNDRFGKIAMVGHNPETHELIERLSFEPLDHVPTCAVAIFRFETHTWATVGKEDTALSHFEFDYPKNTQ